MGQEILLQTKHALRDILSDTQRLVARTFDSPLGSTKVSALFNLLKDLFTCQWGSLYKRKNKRKKERYTRTFTKKFTVLTIATSGSFVKKNIKKKKPPVLNLGRIWELQALQSPFITKWWLDMKFRTCMCYMSAICFDQGSLGSAWVPKFLGSVGFAKYL